MDTNTLNDAGTLNNGALGNGDTKNKADGPPAKNILPDKKLLFFGAGYFVKHFIRIMAGNFHCIVVSGEDAELNGEFHQSPNVIFITGDVNSIVLWKRLPLEEVSHILFSTVYLSDQDVIEEVCRAAREVFNLDIPIIGIGDRHAVPDFFEKYKVIPVDPVEIGVSAIKSIIDTNYAVPSNIGLGKGEMVEVTVFRRSHLINRKLRYMESSRWRVAAIYRFDELVIPTGDSMLMVGDRVVIVGEPSMLTNIVNILMQGVPQFPLQYGHYANVLADSRSITNLEETNYLNRNINTNGFNVFAEPSVIERLKKNDVVTSMDINAYNSISGYKNKVIFGGAGLVVINVPKTFSWFAVRIRYFVRNCQVPLFLSKGSFPYSCILVSLNSDYPGQTLQVGVELSAHFSLPLKIIYVAAPEDLRDKKLTEEYEERQLLIKELENIDRTKHEYTVLEGNPVREMVKFQSDIPRALFVIGSEPGKRVTILEPHVNYLLAARLSCSLLLVPPILS